MNMNHESMEPLNIEDPISEYLQARGLGRSICVHMALRTAVELNIPNIIASSETQHLSAADIVSKIPTSNPDQAAANLNRILRFLASKSLLTVTQKPDQQQECYGLTRLSRYLTTTTHGPRVSWASKLLFSSERSLVESYYRLKDLVLDPEGGGSAFERAHGESLYEYQSKNPELKSLFNDVMSNNSRMMMEMVLKVYDGFKNVNELMDVGGGNGTVLHQIVSAYPHIRATNLDLMETILHAPTYSGVKNVTGNMFEPLPQVETILLKWILHNWSDEECKKLLRNCWASLPDKNGKIIVIESAVPQGTENNVEGYNDSADLDLFMMILFSSGKERSVAEFESMAKASGFAQTNVFPIGQGVHVFEFIKTG